jgi:hypothetical protein
LLLSSTPTKINKVLVILAIYEAAALLVFESLNGNWTRDWQDQMWWVFLVFMGVNLTLQIPFIFVGRALQPKPAVI